MLPSEEAKARTLIDTLEVEVKKVVEAMTGSPSLPSKDGMAQQVLGNYFASGYTPLGEISPNIPIDTCKEEILAVRLLAAADDSVKIARAVTAKGGGDMGPGLSVNHQYADQARDLLNKILTIVAQPPFLLFPASAGPSYFCPSTRVLLPCMSVQDGHEEAESRGVLRRGDGVAFR